MLHIIVTEQEITQMRNWLRARLDELVEWLRLLRSKL